MRAALPQREPQILSKWLSEDLYGKLMKHNEGKPSFILHDGPPYANGDMHMGHALNKTLKDIITRFKNMDGFRAPYIHGWDTHGLPIERQAIAKLGINRADVSISQFRKVCEEFALGYVNNQKTQIQRLGCLGDWDNSYITLDPAFEAKQVEIFGIMAKKGYIYRGLKPIYWCPDCETALAEAEIEYSQDKTKSIYVKFRVNDDKNVFRDAGLDKSDIYFVIWTTTTWTLPGNVAIAVNPDFEYSLVKVGKEGYVIASELIESTMRAGKIEEWEVVGKYKGGDLELITCRHPFLERDSIVIVGEHVTLETGTGCVHTAPGHGVEDYVACQKYKDIPIIVPVDDKGYLNSLAGEFSGMFYEDSNAAIGKKLSELGALYAIEGIEHKYPHCWRCHKPIVFRATKQWFASVDSIKDAALRAIKGVRWIPSWGEERISAMVADRNDWCISRQRTWGVPIPIFYCKECGEPLINDDTVKAVAECFAKNGSGSWYEKTASEILPEGTVCPKCGCGEFTQEKDIMDVWFDSGSSHSGVLEVKCDMSFPADLYLEGNDQYRGWFQSSLLTSIAAKETAPYKSVITHGMIVDEEGKKFSKSAGNGISPHDIIDQYGADILRLWVVSADYKTDMHISKEILKQLSEAYRKIRNTARYILGNISDFDIERDRVPFEKMGELDKWALIRLNSVVKKALESYRSYEFHQIFHTLHNFCVVDMSNFYLDVIKDRLYTEKKDSAPRRAAQSAMYEILESLTLLLVPVLAYTSEEIWSAMAHRKGQMPQALLNDMPAVKEEYSSPAIAERFEKLLEIRNDVSKALEDARTKKVIGHSLGAQVTITAGGEKYEFLKSFGEELKTLFIVSGVELCEGEDSIAVSPSKGEKCERCWMISDSVGKSSAHPTLCARCAKTVEEIQ